MGTYLTERSEPLVGARICPARNSVGEEVLVNRQFETGVTRVIPYEF